MGMAISAASSPPERSIVTSCWVFSSVSSS